MEGYRGQHPLIGHFIAIPTLLWPLLTPLSLGSNLSLARSLLSLALSPAVAPHSLVKLEAFGWPGREAP